MSRSTALAKYNQPVITMAPVPRYDRRDAKLQRDLANQETVRHIITTGATLIGKGFEAAGPVLSECAKREWMVVLGGVVALDFVERTHLVRPIATNLIGAVLGVEIAMLGVKDIIKFWD